MNFYYLKSLNYHIYYQFNYFPVPKYCKLLWPIQMLRSSLFFIYIFYISNNTTIVNSFLL